LGWQGASPLQGTPGRGGAIAIATADLLAERPESSTPKHTGRRGFGDS
jgi:hypothetical protein